MVLGAHSRSQEFLRPAYTVEIAAFVPCTPGRPQSYDSLYFVDIAYGHDIFVKMEIHYYHIDTFTDCVFSGNPAGICILKDQWLPGDLMQKIASENNLPETAFIIQKDGVFRIRWFTPTIEVALCGHATLAAGFVFFHHLGYQEQKITFHSRSGPLHVTRKERHSVLDFPADSIEPVELTDEMKACFDLAPAKAFRGKTDIMLLFREEEEIATIDFSLENIAKLPCRGVIISAPGKKVDFVTRFFAPQSGIDEDPVTGSAFTTLTPYWSPALNKIDLTARQLSKRGGFVSCALAQDRVLIGGESVTYKTGFIRL